MTTSDWKKAHNQLKAKPVKWNKFLKFNKPKDKACGIAKRHCRRCNRVGGHIRKYGIGLCRQCFREIAPQLGFKKYG